MSEKDNAATTLDLDFFRKRLMEEKAEAEKTLARLYAQDAENETPAGESGAVSTFDEDQHADSGADLQMREQDMALVQNTRELLSRIERALTKMEEGTYGLSDRSGKPIPKERLEAVPYATLRVEEQDH